MYLTYGGTFDRIRQSYFKKILRRLAFRQGATVLDYGCGPGDFLVAARSAGIGVLGVDSSERSIRMAHERGLPVLLGGTKELLERPDRFDAILSHSVLEHVPDAVQLVTELCTLLRPGGVMVLSAPTPGPYFWDDPTHVRPFTPQSFRIMSQLVGLEVDYLGYVFGFLLGLEIRAPLIFPLLNVLPVSLGSNLVAFLRKPANGAA